MSGPKKGIEELETAGEVTAEAAGKEPRAAGYDLDEVGADKAQALQDFKLGLEEIEIRSSEGWLAEDNFGDVGITASTTTEQLGNVDRAGRRRNCS